ncbi:putative RING-H2 finger protein ATL19 [Durio zibethinus]|uniref:RING-type E3 ubiquitin transferase n=1 Tax=Durio zibethinus TaxID=66656 RepID=A0A6P6AXT8_DURZI|nr:putative RING-H2 finger protein ATL19 [Durio zibethinus]
MSTPPTTPNLEVETSINLFLILGVIASFLIAIIIVYIISACYEKAKRLLPPQDIETGGFLPQAMQGQGQPRRQQASKPIILAGAVVIYRNIEEEPEEAKYCSNECAICLEEFKERDRCRILSKCKHIYHICCIDRWLLKELHCPLCRGSIHATLPTHVQTA